MESPTLVQINEERKQGFRPTIVCCPVNENKILMFFKKEYSLWMLPQGGIMNGESPEDALFREISEELGFEFSNDCDKTAIYLGEDVAEFVPGKHNISELRTDEGELVEPKGKKYYFFAVYKKSQIIDISKTEFAESFWLDYKAGSFLAGKIAQKGKRRITLKALEMLKSRGLVY